MHTLRLLPGLIIAAACFAQPANLPPRQVTPKPLYPGLQPACAPDDLGKVSLPNTTIDAVTVEPTENAVRVVATVTHPPANDHVKVFVALPLQGWNGRFLGTGGGGFLGGAANRLGEPAKQGYAAAATDTGHEGGTAEFALRSDGRFNWQEIRDFAYLGIHDAAVVGKALTQAFYGQPPRYSYFYGNSTGGRQGLSEAQRFPEDYDGIISGCPAINWQRFLFACLWPQAVMHDAKNFVSKAKLDAATAAAVSACDGADGVVDGIIDDPMHCTYDPGALIGTSVGGDPFTEADAAVIRRIWEGPRRQDGSFMWHGQTRGTDLNTYAGTGGSPLVGKPFPIALEWARYFVVRNPRWDAATLSCAEFELLWNQAVEEFGPVIGTDNPDLARFRDHGSKIIILHGLADQQIPSGGSIDYYERVLQQMGGAKKTAEFARLFLVPGVNHGFRGGPAPAPATLLNAITRWVEEHEPPEELRAELRENGKLVRARPLYPYPDHSVYTGSGSTDDAANFARRPPAR